MANKLALGFTILFQGDGSATTVAVNLATGPVGFTSPGTGTVLNGSLAATATGTQNLQLDGTPGGVTQTSLLLGVVTFTCDSAPSAALHTISGQVLF